MYGYSDLFIRHLSLFLLEQDFLIVIAFGKWKRKLFEH